MDFKAVSTDPPLTKAAYEISDESSAVGSRKLFMKSTLDRCRVDWVVDVKVLLLWGKSVEGSFISFPVLSLLQ